jgi:hypothetical protein
MESSLHRRIWGEEWNPFRSKELQGSLGIANG